MLRPRTWAIHLFILPLTLASIACGDEGGDRAVLTEDEVERAPDPPDGEPASQPERPAPRPQPHAAALTVPTGTTFAVRLEETLGTDRNRAGDAFETTLADPIVATDGAVLVPTGATIRGRVTAAEQSSRAGATAVIKLAFESVSFDQRSYPMRASVVEVSPERGPRRSNESESEPAGESPSAGVLLGQILGKDTESTLEDDAIGTAAGTAIAMGAANLSAVLPSGSRMVIRLDAPVEVRR